MAQLCMVARNFLVEKTVRHCLQNYRQSLTIQAYVKLWSDIFAARHERPRLLKLLREATAGFVAITDAPGNCFVEELLEIYPEAEVICVSRDRKKWWASWEAVAKQAGAGFLNWFLAPVPGRRWYPKLVTQFLEQYDPMFFAYCQSLTSPIDSTKGLAQ
jgi:hypothetical protein